MIEMTGILKGTSEVCEIFPDGKVPLKSPLAVRGTGYGQGPPQAIEVYEVDLSKVSPEAIERILDWFESKWGDNEIPREELRAALIKEGFRIQSKHFSAVPIDLRLFI